MGGAADLDRYLDRFPGVDIASQVAGVVTEIPVESGMDVEQGAKLVQLDIAVELADLASAKATLDEADVAHARQVDLMQKKVTSEANLDTARAKRDTAAASVKRIEAVIAQKPLRRRSRGASVSARSRRANTWHRAWH